VLVPVLDNKGVKV